METKRGEKRLEHEAQKDRQDKENYEECLAETYPTALTMQRGQQ